jgi:hypothetical protein
MSRHHISVAGSVVGVPATYREIVFEGRTYAWRPLRPDDESDMPQLVRSAAANLRAEVQQSQ